MYSHTYQCYPSIRQGTLLSWLHHSGVCSCHLCWLSQSSWICHLWVHVGVAFVRILLLCSGGALTSGIPKASSTTWSACWILGKARGFARCLALEQLPDAWWGWGVLDGFCDCCWLGCQCWFWFWTALTDFDPRPIALRLSAMAIWAQQTSSILAVHAVMVRLRSFLIGSPSVRIHRSQNWMFLSPFSDLLENCIGQQVPRQSTNSSGVLLALIKTSSSWYILCCCKTVWSLSTWDGPGIPWHSFWQLSKHQHQCWDLAIDSILASSGAKKIEKVFQSDTLVIGFI